MNNAPIISIFTCSYNKPQYVTQAIQSVLNQTFQDFEYVILENSTDGITRNIVHKIKDSRIKIFDEDISPREREKTYPESYLKNKYFPLANGKYIMYLADDDLLENNCFEEHIKEFEKNKQERVNFHAFKITYLNKRFPDEIIPANRIFGGGRDPNNRIDGGAIMFEKTLLEDLKHITLSPKSGAAYPPFRGIWSMAHFSDGIFIRHLSLLTNIYPIDKVLHTKRCTQLSTHFRYK